MCAPLKYCFLSHKFFYEKFNGCKKLRKSKLKIDVQVAYDFILMDALFKKKCAYNWRGAHEIKQSYERPAPKKKVWVAPNF